MTEPPVPALFVFLDGVGLGPAGPDNPLSTVDLPAFRRLGGGPWTGALPPLRTERHVAVPLDATLGVSGLPQSGTGQAALFTGLNAAEAFGRHYGPFPPSVVRPAVTGSSVFARLAEPLGPDALAFANAYPDRFFRVAEARNRWTVTTLAARGAGVRLRTADDLRRGDALTADLTGAAWHRLLDPTLAPIDEAEAARRLLALARRHRFTLFELFLTDKAGHSRDRHRAAAVLRSLDRFFGGLLDEAAPDVLLVVSSDHGNLEDLSVRTHTRHPVPLVALGPGAGALADAASLLDVTPALVRLLMP